MGKPSADVLPRTALAQLPRLDALARRRFLDPTIAEEAMGYLLEQLQANDWERVRRFEARSSFATYLTTVATRLLEDFSRERFGRLRIPDWVRAQGAVWVRLFKLLCLERWSPREARQIAADTFPAQQDAGRLDAVVSAIRHRYPNCGAPAPGEVLTDDPDSPPGDREPAGSAATGAPETQLLDEGRTELLQALENLLSEQANESDPTHPVPSRITERLNAHLGLSSEERSLLRLVYQEGLQVTAAGASLGLNPNQTHGRLRRALNKVRKSLQELGFDLEPEDFK